MWAGFTLAALVFGQLTSYVRARAESLGFEPHGGLAARADRLLIILAGALLAGLGVPYVLEIAVVVPGRGRTDHRRPAEPLGLPPGQGATASEPGVTGWRDRAVRGVYRAGWNGGRAVPRGCCAAPIARRAHAVAAQPGRPPPDEPPSQPEPGRGAAGRRSAGRGGPALLPADPDRGAGPAALATRRDRGPGARCPRRPGCADDRPSPGRSWCCRTAATGISPGPGPA